MGSAWRQARPAIGTLRLDHHLFAGQHCMRICGARHLYGPHQLLCGNAVCSRRGTGRRTGRGHHAGERGPVEGTSGDWHITGRRYRPDRSRGGLLHRQAVQLGNGVFCGWRHGVRSPAAAHRGDRVGNVQRHCRSKARDQRRFPFLLHRIRKRLGTYLRCIGIGLPTWFVIGILATLSNEFGAALGIAQTITPGLAVMWCYVGLASETCSVAC